MLWRFRDSNTAAIHFSRVCTSFCVAALVVLLWLPREVGLLADVERSSAKSDHMLARSPWPKFLGTAQNTGLSSATGITKAKPWLFEDVGADRHVIGAPALDSDGTVYIGADGLYALDGTTGANRWEKHVANLVACPPVIGPNSTVYATLDNATFCAIDSRTGAIRWRFKAKPMLPNHGANNGGSILPQNAVAGFYGAGALAEDGTLYITSTNGNLYALSSKNGEEKWHYSTREGLYSSPNIGPDGAVYFTSSDTLYALDGATGVKLWVRPKCSIKGSVAIAADGTIYVKSFIPVGDGKHQSVSVTALNGRTGQRKWAYPMGRGDAASPAVGRDGTVYDGWEDTWESGPSHGKLFAINGITGKQKWTFRANSGLYLAPAIGGDGTVYIGSKSGVMYALDGATGAKKWAQNIGAEIGTSVAVGANGLIYFGANNGTVYALRAADGERSPALK